ncbi:MAG TPA: Maf family protein [Planctomycetaceae bacterium]|nr:Maf family protein [Planctomycetaceae bacterium]
MNKLILASQSRYRLELLQEAGYEVEAIASNVAEPDPAGFADLDAGLVHIAALKARAVWRRGASGLIFAADTVGFVAGEVFGKPADRADARRMLNAISGTTHGVLTGWCLFRTEDQLQVSGVERTTITMRAWTDQEIRSYLDSGRWQGKSGAYGIQFSGDPFVTQIDGSRSNVAGVPLERLEQVLAAFMKPAPEAPSMNPKGLPER